MDADAHVHLDGGVHRYAHRHTHRHTHRDLLANGYRRGVAHGHAHRAANRHTCGAAHQHASSGAHTALLRLADQFAHANRCSRPTAGPAAGPAPAHCSTEPAHHPAAGSDRHRKHHCRRPGASDSGRAGCAAPSGPGPVHRQPGDRLRLRLDVLRPAGSGRRSPGRHLPVAAARPPARSAGARPWPARSPAAGASVVIGTAAGSSPTPTAHPRGGAPSTYAAYGP